jgi:hypothetical protein
VLLLIHGRCLHQHHIENSNCTERGNNRRSAWCYPVPVCTKHRTHRYPQIEAVYGANMICIQQVWKWYHAFANGWMNVMDKDRNGHPSSSNTFSNHIDEMVWADI